MKKLSKIACALGLTLVALPTLAQYEGTSTADRVRQTVAAADTTDALGHIYGFQTAMNSQNYTEAYESWKWLIDKAPLTISSLYKNGPYMLYTLMQKPESTPEQKKQYLDDLMKLYDVRLANLTALNSFDKYPASEGDVLTYKAYWYFRCGNGVDPDYTYNKIYDLYKAGIDGVARMGGKDVSAAVLYEFFTTSKALYDAAPAYYYEQYVTDYMETSKACNKMVQNAKEETDTAKQRQIVKDYDQTLQYIDYTFKQSPAANTDSLVAFFTPKLEEKQGDFEYLLRMVDILGSNGCEGTEIYYNAAQAAYDIEPTFASALGCARKEEALGNATAAMEYYQKAIELSDDNDTRILTITQACKSLSLSGLGDKALEMAKQITQTDPNATGIEEWTRGDIYTNTQKWDNAIASYSKAAELDVTLSEAAQRQVQVITNYKNNLAAAQAEAARRLAAQKAAQAAAAKAKAAASTQKTLSPAQLAAKAEYEKKMAEYKRKKAEYDRQKAAYDARKKADDAFWSEH